MDHKVSAFFAGGLFGRGSGRAGDPFGKGQDRAGRSPGKAPDRAGCFFGKTKGRGSRRRKAVPPVSLSKEERERLTALIRAEYGRLDSLCGADSRSCGIRISTRMVRRLGTFTVKREGNRDVSMEIAISARIAGDADLFTDVIRHEYAHLLVYLREPGSAHGHDRVWKAACAEVGCEPKATRKVILP